jgi:hypothetical protein
VLMDDQPPSLLEQRPALALAGPGSSARTSDRSSSDDLGLELGAGVHVGLSWATGVFAGFARGVATMLTPRVKPASRVAECDYKMAYLSDLFSLF